MLQLRGWNLLRCRCKHLRELFWRILSGKHRFKFMRVMQRGHLLNNERKRMHELRCGELRNSGRSRELHELRCGHILDISRGLIIINVHRLCGGHLRGEHGIDVMYSLQHGHLLSG